MYEFFIFAYFSCIEAQMAHRAQFNFNQTNNILLSARSKSAKNSRCTTQFNIKKMR